MHDTTNTCSCDCGVRATVPSETTVSRESRHDSKQLYNSERILSDGDTRASMTFIGVVSTAVHTFQTSEQLPRSVSAPSTKHKQQGRRTEVLRQATNRGGIQLCVKTLQITMTMIHEGETMKQMPRDGGAGQSRQRMRQGSHYKRRRLAGPKSPKNAVPFQMESKSGPCGPTCR